MTPVRLFSRYRPGYPDPVGLLAVGVVLVITAVIIAWLPDRYVVRFFHDDAFFVLKTAYHVGAGDGSTFDAINPTNGYHPLNLWLLSLISHFVPIKGGTGINAVFAFDMVVTALGLLVINRFAIVAGFTTFARLFCLIGVTLTLAFNDFGLEARLLIPVAWLMVLFAYDSATTGKPSVMLLGATGAVIVLIRLDAVVFVLAVALYAAIRSAGPPTASPTTARLIKEPLTKFVSIMVLPSVTLLGYSIYNWVVFSRPWTVSSWLKFGWPITWDPSWLDSPSSYARVFLIFAVAAGFYLIMLFSRRYGFNVRSRFRRECPLQWLLAAANAYSVLYIFILLLFLRSELASWHVALPLSIAVVTAAYSITFLLDRLAEISFAPPRLIGLVQILVIIVVISFGVAFSASKLVRGDRDDAIAMGLWIRENLPQDVRIFQVDLSGFTAYFSERSVINGDGLINSWEYQEYLRSDRLVDYLKKYNVQYVILTNPGSGQTKTVIPVYLWTEPARLLTFSEEPRKVVRFGRFMLLDVDLSTAMMVAQ